MEEINYIHEGEIEFQPGKVSEYQGTNKFSFKIKDNDTWHSFYQQEDVLDVDFEKLMKEDFKRGFKIKFNGALMGSNFLITDYKITDRTETKKSGSFQREDPKLKIATFSASYTKDLIVAGKVELKDLEPEAKRMKDLIIDLMK